VTGGVPQVTVGIPTFNRAHLLRDSMASVLSQSHRDFRLLVSDNASVDDTRETVVAFGDPRIVYVRSDENIGMVGNFNRIIGLTETEFLILLPDDDILYPDYLSCTVDVLNRHPEVGVAHTAFDLIDGSARVLEHARRLAPVEGPVTIEPGRAYLERSMRSPWTVCWPSALFRTRAIADADGLRPGDEPLADFPLLMRIACRWDFAFLERSLVAYRLHPGAATAEHGDFTGAGYDLRDQPQILYEQRRRFLGEARLDPRDAERYRSLARLTLREDRVRALMTRSRAGASWRSTPTELARMIHADPRTLLVPVVVGLRKAKRAAVRLGAPIRATRRAARRRRDRQPRTL